MTVTITIMKSNTDNNNKTIYLYIFLHYTKCSELLTSAVLFWGWERVRKDLEKGVLNILFKEAGAPLGNTNTTPENDASFV